MRIAIIDLGTNTFNLFISEILPGNCFKEIHNSKTSVKLGEGGINKNHIQALPFERGINAIKKFKEVIDEYRVNKILAFATSAIRSADNCNDFILTVKKSTNIDVQIISGEKEAELIYYGVKSAVTLNDSYSLILDIGGGSTEFIIGNKNGIYWKHSFLLGVARLLEIFNPSDPIKEEEKKVIEDHIENNLGPLFSILNSPQNPVAINELIGSSGSFDSLAEIIAFKYYTPSILIGKTEYTFNLNEYEAVYSDILKSTSKERLAMKGLIRMRVDMIVISAIFVNYIIQRLKLKTMRLSRYSLKEGALWEVMHSPSK